MWFSPITDRQFPIPRHKDEILTGTLKSIMNDAGIS
ncbi:MAG: type II toxin-antitoxin system HicA family toxin [Hungatella sp.]|nr:type II toxin-antitoxin system HicA family toxin [Hungatella sp.]MCI9501377.1 type II toxin-antitoxin system HicA family toxin [Hungatella sp.]MCI9635327.1 type II toxin-antitoxin system HicA family toxin [Hungatella sp.]